jgi:hypothetical protein
MPPDKKTTEDQEAAVRYKKRPFICTVLLTVALTYFAVLALLFAAALIFSGDITGTLRKYLESGQEIQNRFTWFALGGSLLFFAAVAGLLLMLMKRRSGFFLFFISALAIFTFDLIFLDFDWLRYLIHSGLIFITGILHFSKRCY